MDQFNVSVWAGKTKTERDCISPERAKMIHAIVGLAGSDVPRWGMQCRGCGIGVRLYLMS